MNIKELLKQKRNNLSASSITTYSSILKNLHKKVFGKDKEMKENDFDKCDEILDYLKDVPANRRKTILSALVVLTGKDEYRNQMNEDVSTYNREIQTQTKSDTQRENWIEKNEIEKIRNELENDAKILYKKKNKNVSDLQDIQKYIIVVLLGGLDGVPPRRSLDYTCFKIKNIDQEKDNYINGNKLIFNKFKTAKSAGRQELTIPLKLKNILIKWISVNPTDYLLFDINLNPLTPVKLNQRMNRIFGTQKGRSINMMRHVFLTDRFKKTSEENKQLEETMKDMGSSENMALNYIKLK